MSETHSVNLVFEKVSFVSKISTILKATSDDDTPIPGYLYQEVTNITLESDGYCESTLEYLVDRLEKNSCHVKLKVLKLMKYIIENGRQNFKLGLLKASQGIMAATKFSGPPDPLHGNVPYVMVRKCAEELSEMLFNTEQLQTETSDTKQNMVGTKENMGGTSQQHKTGLGISGARTSGAMEGFGNSPVPQNKSFGDTIQDTLNKIVDKIQEGPEDYQKEILSTLQQSSEYRPPASYQGNQMLTTKPVKIRQAPVVRHVPGRAGGGWEDDDEHDNDKGGSHSSGRHSSGTDGIVDRLDSITVEDWSVEENLVKSVIDDGDNFLLTRQEIVSFMKNCGQLNCDKILDFLNQRLQSESDPVNMRSLLLVESFLRKDFVSIEHITKECKDCLLSLYWKKQGPVKSKTKKIIRTLERLQNIVILDDSNTKASENLIDISQDFEDSGSKNTPT